MSAYSVNKVCRRVVHDPAFREQLLTHPEPTLRGIEPALTEEELAALLAGDVGRLSVLGAHDFQLYQLQRYAVLGITLDSHQRSMKEAHAVVPRS